MEGAPPLNPVLVGLTVADDADAGRAGGFTVDGGGTCRIGAVSIALVGRAQDRGIRSWALTARPETTDLDGVATTAATPAEDAVPPGGVHENGAVLIEHVVMTTPDPERTIAALDAAGLVHRRTRLADGYAEPMRQDFFRVGEVILELIGPRSPV